MPITKESTIKLRYFNLLPVGGRGCVNRFFMLIHGIPYEEDILPFDGNWANEKKRLVDSGENPCATLPIVYTEDGAYSQHIALCRYAARLHDLGTGDAYKEYVQDMVADEYHTFCSKWVIATYYPPNEEFTASYKEVDVPKYLTMFESLYAKFKTEEKYLSVSAKDGQPLWGDCAIFVLLHDHIAGKYITLEDLEKYPCLYAMFKEFEKQPSIQEWLAKMKA